MRMRCYAADVCLSEATRGGEAGAGVQIGRLGAGWAWGCFAFAGLGAGGLGPDSGGYLTEWDMDESLTGGDTV